MENRRRWTARAAEGLTIVVSILLALLADAAWGYRGDRADERYMLAGLRSEFREAANEISNDIDARSEILFRTDQLLEARRSTAFRTAPDSIQAILGDLLNWRFYTPAHAVLNDAIESGRLELIRSNRIREALMAYIQARDRLPVFEILERDFVTERLEPYVGSHVALDVVMSPDAVDPTVEQETARFDSLLDEHDFGSLLYLRRDRSAQAQLYSTIVQRRIEEVLNSLGEAG